MVRRSGFSRQTLDHFTFPERPRGVEREYGDTYEQAEHERDQAGPGLRPSAHDCDTIGRLYDAIRANLRALAAQVGEAACSLAQEHPRLGASWSASMACPDRTLDYALAAINLIVEQGGGRPCRSGRIALSNFPNSERRVRCAHRRAIRLHGGLARRRKPCIAQTAEPEDNEYIDSADAARLLDFARASYGLLLRILASLLAAPGPLSRRISEPSWRFCQLKNR